METETRKEKKVASRNQLEKKKNKQEKKSGDNIYRSVAFVPQQMKCYISGLAWIKKYKFKVHVQNSYIFGILKAGETAQDYSIQWQDEVMLDGKKKQVMVSKEQAAEGIIAYNSLSGSLDGDKEPDLVSLIEKPLWEPNQDIPMDTDSDDSEEGKAIIPDSIDRIEECLRHSRIKDVIAMELQDLNDVGESGIPFSTNHPEQKAPSKMFQNKKSVVNEKYDVHFSGKLLGVVRITFFYAL